MQDHANKSRENQARALGNQPSQGKNGSKTTFDIVDNRPEAIQLRRLQEMADNSPQAKRLEALQEMADNSPDMVAQRQLMFGGAAQRQGELEEEELQMKAEAAPIQRQGLEEEELQMKAEVAPIQRQDELEDEELPQGKFDPVQRQDPEEDESLQGKFATSEAPTQLQGDDGPQENNTGLPGNLKAGIENLSGVSLDNVSVHYNSARPPQLQALAYTQGTDIHVGPGQEKHLPHEAWHVVQQNQGRVKPTLQAKGVSINDDPALEREADLMGEKAATQKSPNRFPALQGKSVTNEGGLKSLSVTQRKLNQLANPVQRLPVWRDNLVGVLGDRTVTELENKVGQPTLALYNNVLQPRVLRSVIRAHPAARLQGAIMNLRAAINANTPALDVQDVNYMISQALDAGWADGRIATLIGSVNARNYGEWAHVLINVANGAGWTAAQTDTLINTGHTAAGQLEVLAASAAGRGWSAAELTGAIAASNAQGIANWDAMDVAINEAEVSAAELTGSFAIQNRFNAGNVRVGSRRPPNVPHAACATQVYNYPPFPAPAQAPVSIYFAQSDLDHYKSGHSYPDFALTRGNIRRAPASTLFPVGSNIPALVNASIVAAGNAVPVPANAIYANNQCMFHQMDPQNVRMDMCYPTGGDVVTRGTLLSVKAYVQP